MAFGGPAAAAAASNPGLGPDAPEVTTPVDVEVPGFTRLVSSAEEKLSYQQGQALALAWLGHAGELGESLGALAGAAAQHLARARFQVAANAEGDRYCAKVAASLFVLETIPDTIFICADTRWHVQQEDGPVTAILAQGFVHEAVHLAGTTDECQATRLEIAVAGNNIDDVNLGNVKRYARQCTDIAQLRL